VRFAAGAMRVAAVLVLAAGAVGTYLVFNPSQIPGAEGYTIPGLAAVVIGVLIVAFAVVAALILWGFADGLILLADLDDGQRSVQREMADLLLAARTARGPFHAEAVAEKAPEPKAMR
jgi:hypothetical protein